MNRAIVAFPRVCNATDNSEREKKIREEERDERDFRSSVPSRLGKFGVLRRPFFPRLASFFSLHLPGTPP